MADRASRRCGAVELGDGSIQWRLWAPFVSRVDLVLIERDGRRRSFPMEAEERGYFVHARPEAPEGQRYAYKLNGSEERQDPCSLWQPDGVPGPSALVRPSRFRWTDAAWKGTPREELALYELHVGTFTPEGTFEAIIPRLSDLRDLGITALEIMPIAQFPGTRNWGYDGVLPYAVQNSYGGPHGFQKLVDAAHAAGLAVILDVVYNHLGPEANFLHELGPYFTDRYKTPWGRAINYDDKGCDAVRDWVLDNVRMWLDEFHLDGLRLDAVHQIYDMGARHILRAAHEVAEEVSRRAGRPIHLIAESDLNDPRIVHSPDLGGHGLDAQWSDDFHHAVHSLLTGERRGYYADFGTAQQLATALQTPFLYTGSFSVHRGRKHGAPVPDALQGDRFVICIQNHDQVGNRARGERLATLLESPAQQRLAASLMLLSPYIPLLFMGEEYGETRPFPFFCSFCGGDLVQAVREGRKREFAEFVSATEEIPDPHATDTFTQAKLSWKWPEGTIHAGLRRLYADLLAARRRSMALRDHARRPAHLLPGENVLELLRGSFLRAYFNLSSRPTAVPTPAPGSLLRWSSEWTRYGGIRCEDDTTRQLNPYECVIVAPPDALSV